MKKKILIALCLFACLFGMTGCADILNSIPPSAEEVEKFLDDWNTTKSAVTSTSTPRDWNYSGERVYVDGNVLKVNNVNGNITLIANYKFQGKTYEIKKAGGQTYVDGNPYTSQEKLLVDSFDEWNGKNKSFASSSDSLTKKFNGYEFTAKDVYTEAGRETTSIDFKGAWNYSFEISGNVIGNDFVYDSVKINGRSMNADQTSKWKYDIETVTTTLWKVLHR